MYNCVVMVEYVRSIITAQFSTTTITTYFSIFQHAHFSTFQHILVYHPIIIIIITDKAGTKVKTSKGSPNQKPWLNFINYISTEYSRLSLVSEVPFPSSLLLHMCCRYN